MLLCEIVNNVFLVLHSLIIFFIFGMYWHDYRKLRIKKDWTGLYISYKVWNYSPMWDQYNPALVRKYLWRPKRYKPMN